MIFSEKDMLKKAMQLQQNGELDSAEKIYLEILKTSSDNCEVWNFLGLIKLAKSEFTEAEKFIKKAISIKKDSYFFECLARVHLEQKVYKTAISTLENALKEGYGSFEIYFLLALAYKNNIEYEKAEESIRNNIINLCKENGIDIDNLEEQGIYFEISFIFFGLSSIIMSILLSIQYCNLSSYENIILS